MNKNADIQPMLQEEINRVKSFYSGNDIVDYLNNNT
jgi:hypothetical protein